MRIQIKRDISDNWNSNNPILKSGEFGYDITNNIVKIGDGVTTWKNLSCCNYDDFINKAKAYTDSVIENLIGEAPSTLDTIYEIAQAIQNNQSIIESLNQSIANKVDKVSGKGLSTNDFSNDMKNKLSTVYDHSQKTSGNPHKVTKSDVGLANVDNTSDANKPVSTAQATAIADAKKAGTDAQSSVQTLKTEVNNNTNAISDINSDLEEIFDYTLAKDLFTTEEGTRYRYLDVSGNLKEGSGDYSVSKFIAIESGKTYRIVNENRVSLYCCFYDSSKTFVSSTVATNKDILVANNVAYIRFTYLTNNSENTHLYSHDVGEAIYEINSSMSDYGLNNVFDGQLLAGYYDIYNSGSFVSIFASHMSSKNYISCKEGDIIKIKYGKVVTNQMHFVFFKADRTYISSSVSGQVSEFSAIAPSGCSKFMFSVIDTTENHNTIGTCYPISVYVNNQIDVLENSKAPINHTHSYAGSSSVGGAATSANKLNTNAGNATSPVYFENGVPKACTYTLSKSVPSDAKFTDTWRGIQDNLTSDSSTDSLSAKQGKALANGSARDDSKLPLLGGTIDGSLTVKKSLNVNGNIEVGGTTTLNDYVLIAGKARLYNELIINKNYSVLSDNDRGSTFNLIKLSTDYGQMYNSTGSTGDGTYGTTVGNASFNTRVESSGYIYFNGSFVSSSSGFALSDEKIKSFTDDIENDKDNIIKLFDLINVKSYTRKDAKTSNKGIVNIGISAQELEESILEVGLDNERYNIIDNHYDYMMSRGENEEDAKYYTKFMTVNYDALYTLSLIKMRVMEETHNIKLRELEERISKLENN